MTRGVEISITGGVVAMVRGPTSWLFFLFLCLHFFSSCVICFKVQKALCNTSHEETKTYKQVPQPTSPLHGKDQTPRVHTKSPPRLAPKIIQPQTRKETKHRNLEVERPKPFRRLTKTKEKTLTARNAGHGERIDDRAIDR